MLYDPKWESETKADPLKVDTLIAWLEKQPADEAYCYQDHGRCLFGQYFTAMGFKNVSVGGITFSYGDSEKWEHRMDLPQGWSGIASRQPRTFGAALERAQRLPPK
jgi:hypothetical protein